MGPLLGGVSKEATAVPNRKKEESVFLKLEKARLELEQELGEQQFTQAYALLQEMQEAEVGEVLCEEEIFCHFCHFCHVG